LLLDNLKSKLFKKKYFRINHNIQAREIRLLAEDGKQVGVMSVSEAMGLAVEQGVDLVEIVPRAIPPVCKLIDFKKFLYIEEKKEALERKKTRKSDQKEVWLTPFIAENDLKTRINQIKRFLEAGSKLKIVVKFKGREIGKKDFGYKVIDKVLENVKDCAAIESQPKFLGNRLETFLSPVAKTKKAEVVSTEPTN
jgi:translation initiation factor IF-3